MKNKICIIQSVYNFDITNKMVRNTIKELKINGIKNIKVIKVPGSFEIPQVVSKFIKKYDGFVVVGCIIKGQTANFDLICGAITNGILNLSNIFDNQPGIYFDYVHSNKVGSKIIGESLRKIIIEKFN